MSQLKCPVVNFTLEKHPNADTLSIAHVGNGQWQCVVKTEEFVNEPMAVYIPLDSVAPKDHPFLGFLDGRRVKTIKLRGILSQGMLIPISEVRKYLDERGITIIDLELGLDLTDYLGVKKWEPPVNTNLGTCNEVSAPFGFHKYTDIENWNNYPDVILPMQEVWITEKLHGTSARYALLDDTYCIGSRNRCLELEPAVDTAWHVISKGLDMEQKLKNLAKIWRDTFLENPEDIVDVIIYGEIVGNGVQNPYHYGHREDYGFYVYDISINGRYLPPAICHAIARKVNLGCVPVLKMDALFSTDLLELRNGYSTLTSDHVREGIVVELSVPAFDREVGRVKLKYKSEAFLGITKTEFAG